MQQKAEKTPAIHFARACTFYVSDAEGSWFFNVEVKCFKPIHLQTGMSVDLTLLDSVTGRIFKNTVCKIKDPVKFLEKKVLILQRELLKFKTQLVSVQFNEVRNFGVCFVVGKKTTVELIRQDFAEAVNQDMYKIVSYFNQGEQLVKMDMQNLKTKISEQIIF